MHELGVAAEIHRLCRARIGPNPSARLERVEVLVGELSAVDPELLRYAWEAIVAGGPDAAAVLAIEWRAARQVCEGCGREAERASGSWMARCGRCGQPLRIDGGQELDVIRFSYDSEASSQEATS